MVHLKTVLAIYIGIYLILPGCLCQVLSAFGIDGPGHRSEAGERCGEVAVAEANGALPGCHCEDTSSKVAEPPSSNESESLSCPVVLISELSVGVGIEDSDCVLHLGSRAPPGPSPWSLAVFSGVYLV